MTVIEHDLLIAYVNWCIDKGIYISDKEFENLNVKIINGEKILKK